MLGGLLRKPKPYCYVIKRHGVGTLYSIPDPCDCPKTTTQQSSDVERRSVVAFKYKQQAATMMRLMSDFDKKTHTANFERGQRLVVERLEVDYLQHMCKTSSLGMVLFDYDNVSTHKYEALGDADLDEMRYELENKYKYGYL